MMMIQLLLIILLTMNASLEAAEYARGFTIQKAGSLTLLEIQNQRFCLYSKSSRNSQDCPKQAIPVATPLYRFATLSATHLPMIETFEVENRVVALANARHFSRPWIQKGVKRGLIREVGMDSSLNVERLIEARPEVVFTYKPVGAAPGLQVLKRAGIVVVPINDYLETHPLGPAEWIRVFGAFFERGTLAQEHIESIASEYRRIRSQIRKKMHRRPTVFFHSAWRGQWYQPGRDSFLVRLLADAGGEYVFENLTGQKSVPLSFETVLSKARDADKWILATEVVSRKSLLQQDSRHRFFEAFQENEVYANTYKKYRDQRDDYFELSMSSPHILLREFARLLHGIDSPREWFFRLP